MRSRPLFSGLALILTTTLQVDAKACRNKQIPMGGYGSSGSSSSIGGTGTTYNRVENVNNGNGSSPSGGSSISPGPGSGSPGVGSNLPSATSSGSGFGGASFSSTSSGVAVNSGSGGGGLTISISLTTSSGSLPAVSATNSAVGSAASGLGTQENERVGINQSFSAQGASGASVVSGASSSSTSAQAPPVSSTSTSTSSAASVPAVSSPSSAAIASSQSAAGSGVQSGSGAAATLVTGATNTDSDLVQQTIDDNAMMVANYMSGYNDIGSGSCNQQIGSDTPAVALSCSLMSASHDPTQSSPSMSIFCGAKITIYPQDASGNVSTTGVSATVLDSCPACNLQPVDHIDMHSSIVTATGGTLEGHIRGMWSFDDATLGETYRKVARAIVAEGANVCDNNYRSIQTGL